MEKFRDKTNRIVNIKKIKKKQFMNLKEISEKLSFIKFKFCLNFINIKANNFTR